MGKFKPTLQQQNQAYYHAMVFKRKLEDLSTKLTERGMDPTNARQVAADHILKGKPLPIECFECCEIHPDTHPDGPYCPNCGSNRTRTVEVD